MAPITINFMLACYCSREPWVNIGKAQWDSICGIETRSFLCSEGLLGENYEPTPRGKAWIDMILSTPLPIMKWVRPE